MSTKQPLCLPSLKLLGDYWTLRIIDELSVESMRFCELERRLEEVNTATLAKRLKDMQHHGLLSRNERTRADVTYCLTDLGREALPLISAVNHFSAVSQRHNQNTSVRL